MAARTNWFRGFRQRIGQRGHLGIWLCGLALNVTIAMVAGLLALVLWQGGAFFWPHELRTLELQDGSAHLGVVTGREQGRGPEGPIDRVQLRIGNRDVFGLDFRWFDEVEIAAEGAPAEAVAVERQEYGDLYGFLEGTLLDGERVLGPSETWEALPELRRETRELQRRADRTEKAIGKINRRMEKLRLGERRAAMEQEGPGEEADRQARMAELERRYEARLEELEGLRAEAARHALLFRLSDGTEREVPLPAVVRIYRPNRMGLLSKTGHYLAKWWEFLTSEPRESNTEGGIWPAIFGTFFLVVLMSAAAVPLGVVAALYLREYAREGFLVRSVRVAVQNLAGVPSIVFGVFGLGFFVYGVGGTIDRLFFPERLPSPTFGTGGVLWASLTLALLTVPVVIVATEEALAAVPRGVREASYALGATRWQTIYRVVMPTAIPGILTGFILAVARGAGEVAPLMITGVVKLAPSLPLDGQFPFLHLDRKFMHLGFHIYDVGFQSPNVEAAKPMVYLTTLLLLALVVALNLAAIRIRARLREKYRGSAV
jgi:phosphate transport system permease protein